MIPLQTPQFVASPLQRGRVSAITNALSVFACLPLDFDGDGSDCISDCDDSTAAIYPGAPEVCDALDSDCDGDFLDTPGSVDVDGDGFPACGGADCDDSDPLITLGSTWYLDNDSDNYGDPTSGAYSCTLR